jgi:hypothetical protein
MTTLLRSQRKVIPAAGGGGGALPWRQNEPAGMTFIDERLFDAVQEHNSPHSPAWDNADWQNAARGFPLTIVSDPTAPQSPPNVLRWFYDFGFPTGSAPGHIGVTHTGFKNVYACIASKHSANWVGNASGTNKEFYWWTTVPNPSFFFSAHGAGSGDLLPRIELQNIITYPGGIGGFNPNLVPSALIIRDQWQIREFCLWGNTAGNTDGAVDWYLDGVHIGNVTGIQWTTADTVWNLFDPQPIWGGVDDSDPIPPEGQTFDMDDVYLSGKN